MDLIIEQFPSICSIDIHFRQQLFLVHITNKQKYHSEHSGSYRVTVASSNGCAATPHYRFPSVRMAARLRGSNNISIRIYCINSRDKV